MFPFIPDNITVMLQIRGVKELAHNVGFLGKIHFVYVFVLCFIKFYILIINAKYFDLSNVF